MVLGKEEVSSVLGGKRLAWCWREEVSMVLGEEEVNLVLVEEGDSGAKTFTFLRKSYVFSLSSLVFLSMVSLFGEKMSSCARFEYSTSSKMT